MSPDTACSLFNICLGLFLEQDASVGRVVALDEAHKVWIPYGLSNFIREPNVFFKYMNSSIEARGFTDTLLSAVRL